MTTPTLPASRLQDLECPRCAARYATTQWIGLCPCGSPLLARYDLEGVARPPHGSAPGMWRYAELLPHRGMAVSLGEGWTPILSAPRWAAELGVEQLLIKDESQNPTTSFKARGLSAAVTMAHALGTKRVAIPTAGNAGGALAAYGARAAMTVDVFMPSDTPEPFELEAKLHGARVHRIDGLINDCGALVRSGAEAGKWADISTLKEPYRLEGKKTMGYEIWEQLGDNVPDVILYPTGGGTGLIGIHKAFQELRELGWYSGTPPRMVAVQTAGCAPIVRAYDRGEERAELWPDAETVASGLRVPVAVGDELMLQTLRKTSGTAIAVPEEEMLSGMKRLAASDGIPAAPETGALVAAALRLRQSGWIDRSTRVLLISTGSAHKYPEAVHAALNLDEGGA
ncbi:MAG: threonine synthase [Planctomycetota bacterium]